VLRDAAAGNPTVLPLLEFTLDELWRRSGGSGVLRFSDYESLGGLHGALRLRADEVFGGLPSAVQASLPKVLAALVHTDAADERLVLQNRASLDQFSTSPEARALISAFVAAHLFVGDKASDGAPVIGLAHEALLREWPPAAQWIEQNRELLRLRSGLAAAAALWRDSEFRDERLMVGALLKDSARLLASNPEMLSSEERRFVEASTIADRQRRRRRAKVYAAAAAAIALAILVAAIGPGAINYDFAFLRSIPSVRSADRNIPLSSAATTNLDSSIQMLGGFLSEQLGKRASRPELSAWSLSQMWAALQDLDLEVTKAGKELREAVTATRDQGCWCWRESEAQLPHSFATAWVIYALAQYDQPATPEEIQSVLDRQGATGWWSMFFPARPEERNASTSATALTTLALHQQLARGLVVAEQQAQVSAAVRRGADWLTRRAIPGKARWTEYPPEQIFEKIEFLAVSGLVLHALHTVNGSTEFDRPWLDDLPRSVPPPTANEGAKGYVYLTNMPFTLDTVRHYRFPWMLRATVDSYAGGSTMERAGALLWIESALASPIGRSDVHEEAWTGAEVLFSLRYVQAVLRRNAGSVAPSK
jgi:hypothetical protein